MEIDRLRQEVKSAIEMLTLQVQQQESEIERLREQLGASTELLAIREQQLQDELADAGKDKAEIERLRTVLAWYADEESWRVSPREDNYSLRPSEMMYDMGTRARQALKGDRP